MIPQRFRAIAPSPSANPASAAKSPTATASPSPATSANTRFPSTSTKSTKPISPSIKARSHHQAPHQGRRHHQQTRGKRHRRHRQGWRGKHHRTLEETWPRQNFKAGDLRTHYLTHGGLIPFSYRTDLSYDEFAKFAEHNLDLPGVYLSIRPQRQYPYGSLASHVIGYLKQWEKGDVPESATREFNHYIGEEKGIAGVEASMDKIPRGRKAARPSSRTKKAAPSGCRTTPNPASARKSSSPSTHACISD